MEQRKNIAVIGSGIAGLVSAWLLSEAHDVTLFEKNDYLGGHTNTRTVQFEDKFVSADTGFMVLNKRTYPNILNMFSYLGVEIVETDMSFGVSLSSGLEFTSDDVFLQKRNLFDLSYWKMLLDIIRFNKHATSVVARHETEFSLHDLLAELGVSDRFADEYLLPMAGAIWSTGKGNILEYPAKAFVSFCENHGLLSPKSLNPFTLNKGRLQWYTVAGGAQTYVHRIQDRLKATVLLNTGVQSIERLSERVSIVDERGIRRNFDAVICAAHPDQTLRMLTDASPAEQAVLGAFVYTKNETIMHRDTRFMLRDTNRWPSWTYREPAAQGMELSYYMNRLQHLETKNPVIVTLDPSEEITPQNIFYQTTYEHPRFSLATDQAQREASGIQGERNTYFAGAWLGHGFHEDGLRSALAVVEALGGSVPWRTEKI